MKYTHITLDVGAAEKHYKAIWINSDEFKSLYTLATWFHAFFLVTMENFILTVGLKRLYQASMCCGWNKMSLIREVFTACAGEFMK